MSWGFFASSESGVVAPNIQFAAAGSKASSAVAALDIAYPTVNAGELMVCVRVMWNDNMIADDISGWDNRVDGTSGTGTTNGAHTTRIRIDTKVATGSESGNLSTTGSGTISGQIGVILTYSNATGSWDVLGVGAGISTDVGHAGNRVCQEPVSGGLLDLTADDWIVCGVGIDVVTDLTMTNARIYVNQDDAGMGTEVIRYDTAGTSSGNDGNVEVIDVPYVGADITDKMSLTFSSGIAQCGPAGFIRLRQT